MTEKELYKNAMKEHLSDPTQLSSTEVRKRKGKYGYVRTPIGKYIAIVAVLALGIGIGTFYFRHPLKTPTLHPAENVI